MVVGDDIIPRLSLNAYVKLRDRMKRALLACKLPKHKVLATGLCNCLSPLDWKDTLKIDPAVTGVENQDFEDDVRGLSSTMHQLVTAREDTINKLRASADYLDSIWTKYEY